jgi:hypothetical protein
MPAKKSAKKSAKASSKAKAPVVAVPLYAVPIYAAIKSGDSKAMQKLAATAQKHISDVKTALASLEKKLGATQQK